VFNTKDFPAPCLPTIYVSNGSRKRRPGAGQVQTDTWHVSLLLEPEIEGPVERYDSRSAAVDGAVDLATRFSTGGIDYRGLYQVPREAYLDRLDDLVGDAPDDSRDGDDDAHADTDDSRGGDDDAHADTVDSRSGDTRDGDDPDERE
jgi:hypothetical protein